MRRAILVAVAVVMAVFGVRAELAEGLPEFRYVELGPPHRRQPANTSRLSLERCG